MPDEYKELLEAFSATTEDRRLIVEALRRNVFDVATEALAADHIKDERKDLIKAWLGEIEFCADELIKGGKNDAARWRDWVKASVTRRLVTWAGSIRRKTPTQLSLKPRESTAGG
jgi:hypothetical protein